MFGQRYVSQLQLSGFDKYKYSAVDTSPLSTYVMRHLWDWMVTMVPMWIAPNLLTFTGFVLIVLNYLLLAFYDWDYTASAPGSHHIPQWVWSVSGVATFSAYALDSIDGKHARRTHSSSPLGELFDHGLDSWATSICPLSLFSVFGVCGMRSISAHTLYTVLCVILLTFLLSHWEKYNTGVLFLPWTYDISQVTLTLMYLLTAVFGVDLWHHPLLFGYFFTDILIMLTAMCSVFITVPQTLYNIYRSHQARTLQRDSLYEGLLPLLSPTLLLILLTVWALASPTGILTAHPRLFFWMTGVAFSNVSCRLIVCQMSNTRSDVLHWLLFPLTLAVAAVVAGLLAQAEILLLRLCAAVLTLAHVHYGVCVGKQLGEHLNICVFSLGKRHQL